MVSLEGKGSEGPEQPGVPSGPWDDRVRFADGSSGYAYRPGRLIVHGEAAWAAALKLLGRDDERPRDGVFGFYLVEEVPEDQEASLAADLALQGFTAEPDYVLFADGHGPCGCTCGGCVSWAGPTAANPVYASPVYASPVYASPVYASGYRATGHRTSSARPAAEPDAGRLPPPWAGAPRGPNVLVLDTGLAWKAPGPSNPGQQVDQLPPRLERLGPPRPEDVDWPDGISSPPGDWFLDPAAGHGTFIAGIIEGLAPGCRLGVGRVLGSYGDGSAWSIAQYLGQIETDGSFHVGGSGLEAYDVKLEDAIVNLSFSGYADGEMRFLAAAIRHLQNVHGTVFVASAGNDGCCRPTYPAALPGVIGVGALGPCGPASFTNHGPWVRACAPGADLVNSMFLDWDGSVEPLDGSPDPDDFEGWARWSGTSFAAPIVAGALAREMLVSGCSAREAVARVIDAPWLLRLPGLGTVVDMV